MAKTRINVSLDSKTVERLKEYAWENKTSVSGAIEDWIWNEARLTTDVQKKEHVTAADCAREADKLLARVQELQRNYGIGGDNK